MSCVPGPPRCWNSAKWKWLNNIPIVGYFIPSPGIKYPTKKIPASGKISPFRASFFIDIYVNSKDRRAKALIFYTCFAIVCITAITST